MLSAGAPPLLIPFILVVAKAWFWNPPLASQIPRALFALADGRRADALQPGQGQQHQQRVARTGVFRVRPIPFLGIVAVAAGSAVAQHGGGDSQADRHIAVCAARLRNSGRFAQGLHQPAECLGHQTVVVLGSRRPVANELAIIFYAVLMFSMIFFHLISLYDHLQNGPLQLGQALGAVGADIHQHLGLAGDGIHRSAAGNHAHIKGGLGLLFPFQLGDSADGPAHGVDGVGLAEGAEAMAALGRIVI